MPKNAICAEIGVWRGDFTKYILKKTKPEKIHLIDPWLYQPNFKNAWFGDKLARTQKYMNENYEPSPNHQQSIRLFHS